MEKYDSGIIMTGILITGGSGTFGRAFIKRLLQLDEPRRIVVFSRGELMQHHMRTEIGESERLRYFIGDVRDRDRLRRAMHSVQTVIHAAALKRIEVGFYNPVEMVKTNIGGAINVIEAAQDAEVEKVIALSSDKAFQPISPYGTSKALADGIFLAANNTTGDRGTKFAVARWGNIWRSNGSVVPTWEKLKQDGADFVPVTDPDCTIHPLGGRPTLDEEKQDQMFYLQSRGISYQEGLLMLMDGLDMRDWGWVEFPEYARAMFGTRFRIPNARITFKSGVSA